MDTVFLLPVMQRIYMASQRFGGGLGLGGTKETAINPVATLEQSGNGDRRRQLAH